MLLDGAQPRSNAPSKKEVLYERLAEFAKTADPFTVTFKVMMSNRFLYRQSMTGGGSSWCLAMLHYVHKYPQDHCDYAKDLYITANTIVDFRDKLRKASGDPLDPKSYANADNVELAEDEYELWFTYEMDHDFTVRTKVEPTAKCPSETARVLREGVVDIEPVWKMMKEITGYICLGTLEAAQKAAERADTAERPGAAEISDNG